MTDPQVTSLKLVTPNQTLGTPPTRETSGDPKNIFSAHTKMANPQETPKTSVKYSRRRTLRKTYGLDARAVRAEAKSKGITIDALYQTYDARMRGAPVLSRSEKDRVRKSQKKSGADMRTLAKKKKMSLNELYAELIKAPPPVTATKEDGGWMPSSCGGAR